MLNITVRNYHIYPDHGNAKTKGAHSLQGWHIILLDEDTQQYGLGDCLVWPQFGLTNDQVKEDLRHFEQQCLQLDVDTILDWTADANIASAVQYGIELACFDFMAKESGKPLASRIWSQHITQVQCHQLLGSTREAARYSGDMPSAIKLKGGVHAFDDEILFLQDLVTAHPSLKLRLDANGAWTYDQAITLCEALSAHEHLVLEQPLDPRDFQGLDRLQQATSHVIALDESLVFDQRSALDTACKECVLKPMYLGGIRSSQLIAARAQALAKRICVTHVLESPVGRAGAIHFAAGVGDVGPHGVGDPKQHESIVSISECVGHGVSR